MDPFNEKNYIKIINANNEKYYFHKSFITFFATIDNMNQDIDSQQVENQAIEAIVPDADMKALKAIDTFCSLCQSNNVTNATTDTAEWGLSFLIKHDHIFESIVATSDFLGFEILYRTCKNYFKFLIETMNETEIRDRFKLPDDLLPEDKKKIFNIGSYVLRVK